MDFHQYSKRFHYDNAENFDSNNFNYYDDDVDFDEKLITEVHSRPCLYKKKSDPLEVIKAWNDVADALDACVEMCQKRWTRLKQYFSKERQRRDLDDASTKSKFKLYDKMLFMDTFMYKRKTVHKKQKSTEVLDANRTCAAETSRTGGQGNEYTLDQEQDIIQNQGELELNTSQESNEVAISQSTVDNMEEVVVDTSMDTEPLQCNNVRRDGSSGGVVDELPTVAQKVDGMCSAEPSLPETSLNKTKADSELQLLVQSEFQDISSKIDQLGSKNKNKTTTKDEENTAIAKLITARLTKINESKKKEFKFGCMKILYND